jgi:hypothetical protein
MLLASSEEQNKLVLFDEGNNTLELPKLGSMAGQ